MVLSGAGDGKVRMHDVTRAEGEECVQVYNCHFARVKRIAATPSHPHLFWTAGEDGVVMELDVRVAATCERTCEHALINLNAHVGSDAEVKCVAINPTRPELIAVGANDPYVRVFDRRFLSRRRVCFSSADGMDTWDRRGAVPVMNLSADSEDYSFPKHAATYYCASHLPVKRRDFQRQYRPLASTYLTFSPDGRDLLVNLGGEQIYLFDIREQKKRRSLLSLIKEKIASSLHFSQPTQAAERKSFETSNGFHVQNGHSNGFTASQNGVQNGHTTMLPRTREFSGAGRGERGRPLGPDLDDLKQRANKCFEQGNYTDAIRLYSRALLRAPNAPVLYANRAAAYMKRAWDGDVYAALRDCYRTLELDPDHLKALFRLGRCLFELKHPAEAQCCLELFNHKFPDHATSPAYRSLDRDIKDELFSNMSSESGSGTKASCSARKRIRKGEEESQPPSSEEPSESTSGQRRSSGTRGGQSEDLTGLSDLEKTLREEATDYDLRFCGHCNTTTDIKEANFFGCYGEYIVAGSDDGTFFVWERQTCGIVAVLKGDESIVNCLQPHPTSCLLATSGIESTVKLWAPKNEDGSENKYLVTEINKAATANQKRMNADPLEVMLFNMGYRIGGYGGPSAPSSEDSNTPPPANTNPNITTIQCRQS